MQTGFIPEVGLPVNSTIHDAVPHDDKGTNYKMASQFQVVDENFSLLTGWGKPSLLNLKFKFSIKMRGYRLILLENFAKSFW